MTERTDIMHPHELLGWLLECDSLDDMHATIQAWLRANPRTRTAEEIAVHVDEILAGWYQSPDGYDPRTVSPILDQLADIPARIVRESGRPDAEDFDARAWLHDWAHCHHPALGGRAPVHVLHTPEGVAQVRQLLEQQQSSAFA